MQNILSRSTGGGGFPLLVAALRYLFESHLLVAWLGPRLGVQCGLFLSGRAGWLAHYTSIITIPTTRTDFCGIQLTRQMLPGRREEATSHLFGCQSVWLLNKGRLLSLVAPCLTAPPTRISTTKYLR